jgi:hypothetical protein
MKTSDVISFAALVAILVVGMNFFVYRRDARVMEASLDSSRKVTHQQMKVLQAKLDSVKSNQAVFAKGILYLDSCQMNRTHKADRAEKRGRFLGGLLKGLFPGM